MDEIRQGWSIVLRFKWLIIATTLIAAITAVGLTYILSPQYVAVTPIRFKVGGNATLLDPTQNVPFTLPTSKSYGETYAQAIKSRALAEQVVDKLKLDQLKEDEGNWIKRTKDWFKNLYTVAKDYVLYGYHSELPRREFLIRKLQGSIDAAPVNDSYFINLGVSWQDPELAAVLANTSADIFLEMSRDIAGGDATIYRKYVSEQLDRSQADLDQAQKDLKEFQQKEQIVSLPDQARLDLQSLSQAQNLLREVDLQIRNSTEKLQSSRDQLTKVPLTVQSQTSGSASGKVTGQSSGTTLAQISSEQSSAEQTLSDAQQRSNANASNQRSSSENDASGKASTSKNLTGTESQSNTATNSVSQQQLGDSSSVTVYPNPTYQEVDKNILALESDLKGLQAKRLELVNLISNSQNSLQAFPTKMSQTTRLELGVTAAQNAYLKMRTEYNDALFREARQVGEISIASRAVPPSYPKGPIKGLYGAIGLGVGLLIGLIVASILTGFDTSLRTVSQVESGLGLPILATMPSVSPAAMRYFNSGSSEEKKWNL
ncbi:MAG: hypothetical protein EXR62_02860 [Chloroflexi bacterium]|nr:hypothetical protein [Chloroflexota bacterium]